MSSFLDNFIGGMAFGMFASNPFFRGCFGFGMYPMMYNRVDFGGFANPFPSIFGSGFYSSSSAAMIPPTTFANSSFPTIDFSGVGQIIWDTYTNPDSEYNKRIREYYENLGKNSDTKKTKTETEEKTEKTEKTTADNSKQEKAVTKTEKTTAYEFESVYKKLNITDNRFKKIFEECVLSLNEGRKNGEDFYMYDEIAMNKNGVLQTTYDKYRKGKNLPKRDVKNMTMEEMCDIYYTMFYVEGGAKDIRDDRLALYVFDSDVNMGVGTGKKLLKKSNGSAEKFEEERRKEYKKRKGYAKNGSGWFARIEKTKKYADNNFSAIA